ncbi:MAG TPA: hypothetical protein DDW78_03225 [Treponema sp.]|nr:hypothetical protein [Treponema sp.]
MRKFFLLFLVGTLALYGSATTNVKTQKTMYVKEHLKLRTEESISSSTITVMRIGSEVRILALGKEEVIDKIRSNWVRIEVLEGKTKDGKTIPKGTEGWCFGGYLAGYVGKYDYVDLSDSAYTVKKIAFKTQLDELAWGKLAGFYFGGGPRKTISDPEAVDTPWGMDYTFSGLGCHSIAYKNGMWIHGGDGESEEFALESISDDGNSFTMRNKYHSQTWRLDGEYLRMGAISFYKITGPDCYKRFLRQFIQNYNESVRQYALSCPKIKEIAGNTALEILKALSAGDIASYAHYARKDANVKLRIGGYRTSTDFSYNDLLNETESIRTAFEFMKTDLASHANEIDAVEPHVNEFIRSTVDDMKRNYPEADVLVEYIFNKYECIELFFKTEADSLMLIGLKEYAEFRP